MKIVHFNSGLGNQIFQYMFFRYMQSLGHTVYGYYNKKWLQQHNGLEVDNVLNGDLPPATILSNLIVSICRFFHRFDKKGRFFVSDNCYNPNGVYYSGYWQDKRFFEFLPKPKFRAFPLNSKNKEISSKMRNCNSVSIHIRRGDYLSPEVVAQMGNICTLEYYQKAIQLIKSKIQQPIFFVFSDDIEWARDNIKEDNIYFIDWNTGKDSFLDMFLMAQCKAHIIANSSFSYWGAYMSEENLLTVLPSRWYNDIPSPDIAMDDWIKISV